MHAFHNYDIMATG